MHKAEQLPNPADGSEWMIDLTEEERLALPAVYHRPYFNDLGQPGIWVCEACWGDGWSTAWPCPVISTYPDAADLVESLKLGWAH